MAINANESHKNQHRVYIGGSGSGKTFAVKKYLATRPKANVIVYDSYEVYGDVMPYAKTTKELAGLMRENLGSNKPLRVACSQKNMVDKLTELVWMFADGGKETIVVYEEVGNYLTNTTPVDVGKWYELITVGRKYGVTCVSVSQRPQNVNKVLYDEAVTTWIGFAVKRARSYIEKDFGVDMSKIEAGSFSHYIDDGKSIILCDKNGKPIK